MIDASIGELASSATRLQQAASRKTPRERKRITTPFLGREWPFWRPSTLGNGKIADLVLGYLSILIDEGATLKERTYRRR